MKFSFCNQLSFFGIITGIILTISSENPFGIWFGLELNMISFICYVMFNQYHSTISEVMLKYFLIQTPASLMFLLMFMFSQQFCSFMSIFLAMSLKAGVAPFHFWLPQISESLSWSQLGILLTFQKLAPLTVMTYTFSDSYHFMLLFLIFSSAMVGAFGGLNETSLRKLLSFSSIAHLAWMLSSMMMMSYSWCLYFTFYLLIVLSLFIPLHYLQLYHMTHIWNSNNLYNQISILTALLSLMGLPPLLGFMPKLMVITILASYPSIILMIILISSTLITLYYYLRFIMTFMFLKQPMKTFKNLLHSSNIISMPIIMNISGLMILPILNFI
uniref:NADH dehydrogenase subunit 2 n=1 Tax=Ichthyoxenos japonensis TaxID=2033261 RepID=UPI000EF2EBC9|nr:NADH dehydrogenase subunit 2 [Ichthyoxenos japonensis]ATO58519.1 NADH dehydrogenase subunit 2 [Ichthyoxenos japonensis]